MKRTSYSQFCGVACALDLIGDRWSLLVVRELLFGAKRFTDLLEGLPGISTNTLTARLSELEESGLLTRRRLPAPLAATVVELTERGRGLEPVLIELARWGTAPLLEKRPRHGLRPAWLALALRTYYDAAGARGSRIRIALVLGKGTLSLELGRGPLAISEGEPSQPADLRITAKEHVLLDVLRGALSVASARRSHELELEGDAQLVPRLLAAFPIGAGVTRAETSPS